MTHSPLSCDERDPVGHFAPGNRTSVAGGLGKAANRTARQDALADELVARLPPLDTPENCRKSCELVQRYAALGAIPGVTANACNRSIEIALRAIEADTDLRRLREVEEQLARLEAERRPGRSA